MSIELNTEIKELNKNKINIDYGINILKNESFIKKIPSKFNWLLEVTFFFIVFLFIFCCYVIIKPIYNFERTGIVAQCFFLFLITIVVAFGIILFKKGKLTSKTLIFLLILISIFVHITYMINTPLNARQHDTWSSNCDAHFDYALSFYLSGKLPTHHITYCSDYLCYYNNTGVYQFYHPPLNAFIQGIFMKIYDGFNITNLNISSLFTQDYINSVSSFYNVSNETIYSYISLYGSNQILSCFYTIITSYFIIKIISLFVKKEKSFVFASVFALFMPRLFQLGAQLNNDTLSLMLSVLSLYYTLKWFRLNDKLYQKYINISLAGLFLGLAMMTKLNSAIIAFPMAFIFLYSFYKDTKDKKGKMSYLHTLLQFALFLSICAPLGLWFSIYSKVVLNIPFGFVYDFINQNLYTGDINFFYRLLLPISFHDLSNGLFASAFNDYNLPTYLVKTSLFGEFSYWQSESFGFLLMISSYVLIISTIVLFIYYLVKIKNYKSVDGLFAFVLIIFEILLMLYFNIKMPYGCTMDFRYIVPIIIGFVIFAYKFNDEINIQESQFANITMKIFNSSIVAYSIFSCLFYFICI